MDISDDIKERSHPVGVVDEDTGETRVVMCLSPYALAGALGIDTTSVRNCVIPVTERGAVKDPTKRMKSFPKKTPSGRTNRMIPVEEAIKWAHNKLGMTPNEDDLYIDTEGYFTDNNTYQDTGWQPTGPPRNQPKPKSAEMEEAERILRESLEEGFDNE